MTVAMKKELENKQTLELEGLVNKGQAIRREREALEAAQIVAHAALAWGHQERAKRLATERLFKKGTCGLACAGFALLMGFAGVWPLAIIAAVGAGWAIAG